MVGKLERPHELLTLLDGLMAPLPTASGRLRRSSLASRRPTVVGRDGLGGSTAPGALARGRGAPSDDRTFSAGPVWIDPAAASLRLTFTACAARSAVALPGGARCSGMPRNSREMRAGWVADSPRTRSISGMSGGRIAWSRSMPIGCSPTSRPRQDPCERMLALTSVLTLWRLGGFEPVLLEAVERHVGWRPSAGGMPRGVNTSSKRAG